MRKMTNITNAEKSLCLYAFLLNLLLISKEYTLYSFYCTL